VISVVENAITRNNQDNIITLWTHKKKTTTDKSTITESFSMGADIMDFK
jgi:hypothetical protein